MTTIQEIDKDDDVTLDNASWKTESIADMS
jgi:hypothetical protein